MARRGNANIAKAASTLRIAKEATATRTVAAAVLELPPVLPAVVLPLPLPYTDAQQDASVADGVLVCGTLAKYAASAPKFGAESA